MSSGLFKAVCYRCAYEGPGLASRCPACQFPMILEAEGTPPGRPIDDILARVSIGAGAPPLPGVHAEKRKAQLLAEARQERRDSDRRENALPRQFPQVAERELYRRGPRRGPPPAEPGSQPSPAVPAASHLDLGSSVKIPRFRTSSLAVALLCASAVAAGVVAAAIQSGGF